MVKDTYKPDGQAHILVQDLRSMGLGYRAIELLAGRMVGYRLRYLPSKKILPVYEFWKKVWEIAGKAIEREGDKAQWIHL